MKRILLVFFCAMLLTCPVSAHPGRTDSSGGHYDRSTGEYHYHHGYPAHQHAGGICEYNFDDQTGRRSGSSNSTAKSTTVSDLEAEISRLETRNHFLEYELEHKTEKDQTALVWAFITFFVITLAVCILIGVSKRSQRKHMESEKQELEKQYNKELEFAKKYSNVSPLTFSGAPKNIYVDSNGTICMRDDRVKTNYGSFTVYTALYSKRFHRTKGCSSASTPVHLEAAFLNHLSPCSKCCQDEYLNEIYFPMKRWYPEYQNILKIKKGHDIP